MGTDNLFHKKKMKAGDERKRRRARRDAYKKVLIVTEGEKTEPHYFLGVREYYSLNTANVEVTGDGHSAPSRVWDFARQRYREEKDAGDPFDMVFCVFDKDSHACYERTCSDIDRASPKDTFYSIRSVPCFEFWLILHFVRKNMPYEASGGRSASENVVKDLKSYIEDYEKNDRSIFEQVSHLLNVALHNSASVMRESERHGSDNPSTNVHELIEVLRDLKS